MAQRYSVVTDSDMNTFVKKCNEKLSAEWKLQGGVATIFNNDSLYIRWSQAFFKDTDKIPALKQPKRTL